MKRDCRCPRARHQHGTNHAYSADACRCQPCRDAHNTYARTRYRQVAYGRWDKWVHPMGSVRRIRALHALGWPMTAVADQARVDVTEIRRIARGVHGQRITAQLAARIADAYDKMSMQLPDPTTTNRARRYAAVRGWLPPMAWDDDSIDDPAATPATSSQPADALDQVAVHRAMHGDPVPLTRAERGEAVRRLAAAGYSLNETARLLGVTQRTVSRRKAVA